MTVIELQFPAGGRFHTTPWGRHVNEGTTEWPPSPWRIQRALVATWYLKAREDVAEDALLSLMDALATVAPVFELPPAIQSHTRHYMPTRGGDKTKVFDTFVQSSEPVRIAWEVSLNDVQHHALGLLCERLGYLGRAESIVEASLLPAGACIVANATPLSHDEPIPTDSELVRVLCPERPDRHAAWLASKQIPQAESPSAKGGKSKSKGKGKSAGVELPSTIFAALQVDTATLQAQGWSQPPGSRWLDYTRKITAFQPKAVRARRVTAEKITVARFAISSNVLPRITQAVSVADRLHKTLVSYADHRGISHPGVFTGLAADGKPLAGAHQHTHIFCEVGEKRDTIGFITLYAPEGYQEEAIHVIEDVQRSRLWGKGDHDIDLILIGVGDEKTFPSPLFKAASKWRSLTPYVSTQHLKTFRDGRPKMDEASGWQKGSAAHSLMNQLEKDPRTANKLKPGGLKFEKEGVLVSSGSAKKRLRCLQYQTVRHGGNGQRGNGDAGSFVIEFTEPVQGPLAFGYGSHFGLGLFVPAPEFSNTSPTSPHD